MKRIFFWQPSESFRRHPCVHINFNRAWAKWKLHFFFFVVWKFCVTDDRRLVRLFIKVPLPPKKQEINKKRLKNAKKVATKAWSERNIRQYEGLWESNEVERQASWKKEKSFLVKLGWKTRDYRIHCSTYGKILLRSWQRRR